MKKKILSFVLIMALLLSSISFIIVNAVSDTNYTEPTIFVEKTYAIAGTSVNVNLYMVNNPGVAGARITVSYNSKLTLTDATSGETFAALDYTKPGRFTSPCSFTWDSESAEVTEDGIVLTLSFDVSSYAEAYEKLNVDISYIHGDIYNSDLESLDFDVVSESITVINFIPGDVNDDGTVNGKDITLLRRYYAGGYDVTINESAADVNDDGAINGKDITLIRRYNAGGYDVELLPSTPKCSHSILSIEAKAETCTENGHISYWYCTKCEKCFIDEHGTIEIKLEDTIIKASGHTYSTEWVYDQDNHWRAAICEHSELLVDKSEHIFGTDSVCDVCSFDISYMYKLATPQSVAVKYDVVSWTVVPNADSYTIVVNGDYTYVTRNNECSLASVKNSTSETLFEDRTGVNKHGQVSVTVYANDNGKYTKSDSSDVVTYYYVPDTGESQSNKKALAENYGLGLGYNMVETGFYAGMQPGMAVFDVGKLLTVDNLTEPSLGSGGGSSSYYYTSIDDYVEQSTYSDNLSANVGIPENPYFTAGLKADLSYSNNENYTSHKYYCSYVSRTDTYSGIVNFGGQNSDVKVHCLSQQFLQDLRRESKNTKLLTDEQLCEYLYEKYGTHVALGILKGGYFVTSYSVWTDSETDLSSAKNTFNAAVNANVGTFFNAKLDVSQQGENTINITHESTESLLKSSYYGGSIKVGVADGKAAIDEWSLSDGAAVPLAFTDNGAIAISSLIELFEQEYGCVGTNGASLGELYGQYIDACADDLYHKLYDQYTYEPPFAIEVVAEDGRNVLTIDLSMYQTDGKLDAAGCSYFTNGIFTVYPNMLGEDIDAVRLIGAMDKNNTAKQLLNGFSLALKGKWTSDVEIILENFGAVASSDYGIVDSTGIPKTTNVTISYEGINFVKDTSGVYHCYVNGEGVFCHLVMDSTDVPQWMFGNVSFVDGAISLPVSTKENYAFAGWFDGEGNAVTNALGTLDKTCPFGSDAVTVYAQWKANTYTITLDNQGATTPGTDNLYLMYRIGYSATEPANEEFTQINSITIPTKTGYIFGGYYTREDVDAGKVVLLGVNQYIDANGIINNVIGEELVPANMAFKDNVILYAKWTPVSYTVEYIGNSNSSGEVPVDGAVGSTSHTYNIESKLASSKFTCSGKSFVCWNTEKDGSGTDYYAGENYKNLTTENGAVVKLYAKWTDNIKIELKSDYSENSYTTEIYMAPEMDAIYSDSDCENVLTRIQIPTRTEYIFGGFYDSVENNNTYYPIGKNQRIDKTGNFIGEPKDMNDDRELEALWDLKEFTAIWDKGENYDVVVTRTASPLSKVQTGVIDSGATIYYGDELLVSYTAHRGYEFVTQGTSNIKAAPPQSTVSAITSLTKSIKVTKAVTSADIKVTAKLRTFTVTYNLNKAIGTDVYSTKCFTEPTVQKNTSTVTYSKSYKLDVPTAEHYTFTGWYTADGTKIANADGSSVQNWTYLENTTVYAHWSTTFKYIKTPYDLLDVESTMSYTPGYMLIADIDLSVLDLPVPGLTGDYWVPIRQFSGTFDGLGHKISNLVICPTVTNAGLFSELYNATVQNLDLVNVSITNTNVTGGSTGMIAVNTGGLAGRSLNSKIQNVNVVNVSIVNTSPSGINTGGILANTGALVGYASNSIFTNCYSSGTITTGTGFVADDGTEGAGYKTGQICGDAGDSTMIGCTSDVFITNNIYVCSSDEKINDSGRWNQHNDFIYTDLDFGVDKTRLKELGVSTIKVTATIWSRDDGNDGYHHIFLYNGNDTLLGEHEFTDTGEWAMHSFDFTVNTNDLTDDNLLKVLYGASGDFNDDWMVGDLWLTVEYS